MREDEPPRENEHDRRPVDVRHFEELVEQLETLPVDRRVGALVELGELLEGHGFV